MSDAEAPPVPYEVKLSISGPDGAYAVAVTGPDLGVQFAAEAALHALNAPHRDDAAHRFDTVARAILDVWQGYLTVLREGRESATSAASASSGEA